MLSIITNFSWSQVVPEKGARTLILAHILCLFSMVLYAGNYVTMALFNRNNTGFLFNVVRTLTTIPVVPLLVLFDPGGRSVKKNKQFRTPGDSPKDTRELKRKRRFANETINEIETLTQGGTNNRAAEIGAIEKSSGMDGIDSLSDDLYIPFVSDKNVQNKPLSSPENQCHALSFVSQTVSDVSTNLESHEQKDALVLWPGNANPCANMDLNLLHMDPANGSNESPDLSRDSSPISPKHRVNQGSTTELERFDCARDTYESRERLSEGCHCDPLSCFRKIVDHKENNCQPMLPNMSQYRLIRAALPSILISSLSGSVRQMVVPIALMYTPVATAGKLDATGSAFEARCDWAFIPLSSAPFGFNLHFYVIKRLS